MTAPTLIRGYEAKFYYQSSGTRETWPAAGPPDNLVEVTGVRDVAINLAADETDSTTRADGGWKTSVKTLKSASVEWEMLYNKADTAFAALFAAALAGSTVALAVLDGDSDTTGTAGLWADMQLSVSGPEQPLNGISMIKFSASSTKSDVPPEWIDAVATP